MLLVGGSRIEDCSVDRAHTRLEAHTASRLPRALGVTPVAVHSDFDSDQGGIGMLSSGFADSPRIETRLAQRHG